MKSDELIKNALKFHKKVGNVEILNENFHLKILFIAIWQHISYDAICSVVIIRQNITEPRENVCLYLIHLIPVESSLALDVA